VGNVGISSKNLLLLRMWLDTNSLLSTLVAMNTLSSAHIADKYEEVSKMEVSERDVTNLLSFCK